MEKIYSFVVKGRKWWDKVNGNTYNSAKVYVIINGVCVETLICNYGYGYGSDYYYKAIDTIKEYCNHANITFDYKNILDVGADFDIKRNVKNYMY